MGKKKKSKVTEEELQVVKGVAGAKSGLVVGAKLGLESKFLAIPVVLGTLAATLLTGKETDEKVKKVINLVKESSMDKAKFVFEKHGMGAPAGFAMGTAGTTALALLAASTMTDTANKKKKASKKNMIKKSNFKKEGAIGIMGAATGVLIAGSLAPKPRKTATTITNVSGKNIKMKKMVNLPRKK